MRHRKKSEKFSRSRAQRKALVNTLLRALLINERIQTTESRAKALRSHADRLITLSKSDTLHSRRLAYSVLQDHSLVKRLFSDIGPRYKEVVGGYTRVLSVGLRKGDGAKVSLLELTKCEKPYVKKVKVSKSGQAVTGKAKRTTTAPQKKEPQKKGIMSGVRKIFKKERDSL